MRFGKTVPSDTAAYPRTSDIVSKDLLRSGEISHYERLTNKTGPQDDWMTITLQSMADPRFVGEENDERILPAVDAWLHFLSTFPARVNSFRPIDSFDKHGNTLLHDRRLLWQGEDGAQAPQGWGGRRARVEFEA